MSVSIDEQFIDYIVKTIVGNPDAVSIKRTIDEKGVLLELTVDPEDLGRVIGKRGAGAQALRTLLRALGTKNDARYNLKIVDVGGEKPDRSERPERTERSEQPAKSEDQPEVTAEEGNTSEEVSVEEELAAEEAEPEVEPVANDDGQSNFDRTRRELADLDDLDI